MPLQRLRQARKVPRGKTSQLKACRGADAIMPLLISSSSKAARNAVPVYGVRPGGIARAAKTAAPGGIAQSWAKHANFTGKAGETLLVPDAKGKMAAILFGLGKAGERDPRAALAPGLLAAELPAGAYRLAGGFDDVELAATAWGLGGYRFDRYRDANQGEQPALVIPEGADGADIRRVIAGVSLTRDLINTPANDMGPGELEAAFRKLGAAHNARVKIVKGKELDRDFPLIQAVGRASDRAPRLLDLRWGAGKQPRVTLVGKGVCFDTGGLNLKPGQSMALMKKDMGGAANVMGLAAMIMAAKLKLRLRVLVPAVDNNVSGNAFRPGDVLTSRQGRTVEIGNTDAEGRLVLADALDLADEEAPDLMVDMATLTGAARVALGPELPPFYTDDDKLAAAVMRHAESRSDPVWRMPFWQPYDSWLDSKIADVSHISDSGLAGSITAALFLRRFVKKAKAYMHFDIFAWTPKPLPGRPYGGEAQAIRALYALLTERYGR